MRVLIALVLVLACAANVGARTGQNPTSGSPTGGAGGACTGGHLTLWTTQDGSGPQGFTPGGPVIAVAAGVASCSLVMAPCTGTFTRIACSITTGTGTTISECGIYSATGATRIASTGPQTTGAAKTMSATVPAFTLTSGTRYLTCIATTATATLTYRAFAQAIGFSNTFTAVNYSGGTLVAQRIPFNDECTAGSTPYTCCSGAKAGTCNGMADMPTLSGLVSNSVVGPLISVAP